MQAIILAAGMGRRLGEFTKENTKCMVPVNGTRLIDRALVQLTKINLNRIVVVVGYESKKLIDYIDCHYADKIKMIMKPKSFDAQGNTRTVIKNIGNGDDNMTLGL